MKYNDDVRDDREACKWKYFHVLYHVLYKVRKLKWYHSGKFVYSEDHSLMEFEYTLHAVKLTHGSATEHRVAFQGFPEKGTWGPRTQEAHDQDSGQDIGQRDHQEEKQGLGCSEEMLGPCSSLSGTTDLTTTGHWSEKN